MQATKSSPGSSLGGNVIPAQQIHFAKPHVKTSSTVAKPVEPEPEPPPIAHQPQVTLIKEGDIVSAIEVLCTCGEVIRLECKYVD